MKLSVINKLLIFCLTFATFACVDSSPYFGNEIVPPNQMMITKIDSSISFNTYTIAVDSFRSSNLGGIMYFGQRNSKLVGQTTSQLFSNYSPAGFLNDKGERTDELIEKNFGSEPRIDSMILNMGIDFVSGDSLKLSKLEIFRVINKDFIKDSTYYSNFNIEPFLEKTPLATVTLKGNKVVKTKLPVAYAKEHLDITKDTNSTLYNPRKFIKKFKGLYFKVTPMGEVGAFYKTSLSSAFMTLYYNNKDFKNKDTVLKQNFYFYNSTPGMTSFNTSIQMYKHDYKKADVQAGGVNYKNINDTINPQPKVYVSGMAGLGTQIEFKKEDIAKFIEKAKLDIHSTDPAIGIHRAEIVWKLIDNKWENLNKSFTALGVYYNANKKKFIPDYDPIYAMANKTTAEYKNSYGLLNRSNGYYVVDITGYVQKLVRGLKVSNKLQLLPEYYEIPEPGESVTWGSLANKDVKPYLVITYTLVK